MEGFRKVVGHGGGYFGKVLKHLKTQPREFLEGLSNIAEQSGDDFGRALKHRKTERGPCWKGPETWQDVARTILEGPRTFAKQSGD